MSLLDPSYINILTGLQEAEFKVLETIKTADVQTKCAPKPQYVWLVIPPTNIYHKTGTDTHLRWSKGAVTLGWIRTIGGAQPNNHYPVFTTLSGEQNQGSPFFLLPYPYNLRMVADADTYLNLMYMEWHMTSEPEGPKPLSIIDVSDVLKGWWKRLKDLV